MTLKTTTIVVNWNTVGLLDGCLRSIVDHTPPEVDNEIIVVDNGSTDGSVAALRADWPDVAVIANEENLGFCRANNQAIRLSNAEFVLLVNTDARVGAGTIPTILGYFARDERAAVVGPRLVYGDGSFQRWTAGRTPGLGSMARYLFGVERLARSPQRGGLYLGVDTDRPFRPDWVSSAVMALRRSALDEIGLLNEEIFVYMDDVDICDRARAAGWHVWYAADTTATHFMGGSSKRVDGRASPEALRALNRWFLRRHGRLPALALQGMEIVGFGGRAAAFGADAIIRRTPGAAARMRAHLTHTRLALEVIHV